MEKNKSISPEGREGVQKLEEFVVIQKYTLQLEHKKLGIVLGVFFVKRFYKSTKNVFKKINNFQEAKEAHRIKESQNIHLKAVDKNQFNLQKLLSELMGFSY